MGMCFGNDDDTLDTEHDPYKWGCSCPDCIKKWHDANPAPPVRRLTLREEIARLYGLTSNSKTS